MAHTFKSRDRKRPHNPTTNKPSTYAAEAARLAKSPSDVVTLAESRRDHKLDPVHLPNGAIARAFSKEAERYLVTNPQALFKPLPKADPEPAAAAVPAKGKGRWTKKHNRAPTEFTKRLSAILADKGMSQKAFGDAIGMGSASVWSLLNPKAGENPKPRYLGKIATALGVDADWLWTGTGERVPPAVAAPLPAEPPKATAANPFPTAPPVNASPPPTLGASDRRLLNAVADTQAAVAETLESFGLTQAATMTRLAAELIRRATDRP
jgi:transcriptional regulator with XRE-family HTH domain